MVQDYLRNSTQRRGGAETQRGEIGYEVDSIVWTEKLIQLLKAKWLIYLNFSSFYGKALGSCGFSRRGDAKNHQITRPIY